jgi:endonuclease V-like protein UPF0215 family
MSSSSPRQLALQSPAASSHLAKPVETLLLAIKRLQNTLDAENAQIASRKGVDFGEFNLRKSQGLLELTRLMPVVAGSEIGSDLREALNGLRAKLEDNRRILRVQLKAVQEVSEIIARTIQAGQSDGTYSAYAWRD